jgi:AraC family transcriptional regulator, exoenzyme S synthesis regulatory protein ExsA
MNIYEFQKANKDTFHQFSVKDVLFVYYNCPQKDKIIQLYSPYNQFTFGLEGRKTFYQADKSWTVSKDSGFLLKRTAFNEEISDYTNDWKLLAFYLKDDYLKELFNEFRPHLPLNDLPDPPNDMIIKMDINDRIRSCYNSLLPYFNQTLPLPESILELKFKELLYNILINPANQRILSYINSLADGYETPLWEIMEKNYMYGLKLSEYAQLANRSLASFKREFQDYYDLSPGKWLTEKRLQRAKRFLKTSRKNISDIAFENGFNNVSHFSRIFKEHFGKSPVAYRNSSSKI